MQLVVRAKGAELHELEEEAVDLVERHNVVEANVGVSERELVERVSVERRECGEVECVERGVCGVGECGEEGECGKVWRGGVWRGGVWGGWSVVCGVERVCGGAWRRLVCGVEEYGEVECGVGEGK